MSNFRWVPSLDGWMISSDSSVFADRTHLYTPHDVTREVCHLPQGSFQSVQVGELLFFANDIK